MEKKNLKEAILTINKAICKNITMSNLDNRGFFSQNILSQLRNFVEYIAILIHNNGVDAPIDYEDIKKGVENLRTRGELRFIRLFHDLLQISASHYTLDEENSERLMLKYKEYLFRLKKIVKTKFNIDIIENIAEFPINSDSILQEYYEKIAEKIDHPSRKMEKVAYSDRYYIQKIKPFFVNSSVYYEITYTRASDYASKFDRIISFTDKDISYYYAVKLEVSETTILMLGRELPIQIITDWEVSIRPCELNNFSRILSPRNKVSITKEYYNLMNYLKHSGNSLVDIAHYSDSDFQKVRSIISKGAKTFPFYDVLNNCRMLVKKNRNGQNVIRYLLLRMNNRIIKQQYRSESCDKLSSLFLKYGCIPFDKMPFNTSLIQHNPRLIDLYECIDHNDREHELLARKIKNNTEKKGQIYTTKDEMKDFQNIDELIYRWNCALYRTHNNRRLEVFNNYIYIKEYEEYSCQIIRELQDLSKHGFRNYRKSVENWLNTGTYVVDCEEKKTIIKQMFETSKVALIYGSDLSP